MSDLYEKLDESNQYPRSAIREKIKAPDTRIVAFRLKREVGENWIRFPLPSPEELEKIEHAEYASEIDPLDISDSLKAVAENEWYAEFKARLDQQGWEDYHLFLQKLLRQAGHAREDRNEAIQEYCNARHELETLKEKIASHSAEEEQGAHAGGSPNGRPGDTNQAQLDQLKQEVIERKEGAEDGVRMLALLLWRHFLARAAKWCYGYLGDARPWDELKLEVASLPSPPFNDRPKDYLKAALEVREEAPFDSLNAYCRAIAKRAPTEEGTIPENNTVRDWLIRDGFYEPKSKMKVEEVRERVEETAHTHISD